MASPEPLEINSAPEMPQIESPLGTSPPVPLNDDPPDTNSDLPAPLDEDTQPLQDTAPDTLLAESPTLTAPQDGDTFDLCLHELRHRPSLSCCHYPPRRLMYRHQARVSSWIMSEDMDTATLPDRHPTLLDTDTNPPVDDAPPDAIDTSPLLLLGSRDSLRGYVDAADSSLLRAAPTSALPPRWVCSHLMQMLRCQTAAAWFQHLVPRRWYSTKCRNSPHGLTCCHVHCHTIIHVDWLKSNRCGKYSPRGLDKIP
jgi:hypothetical protein